MKKQASVKMNCMPSLNDPRNAAETRENVKVKFTLEQATMAQRWSKVIALLLP
jgi:hypothetical protein